MSGRTCPFARVRTPRSSASTTRRGTCGRSSIRRLSGDEPVKEYTRGSFLRPLLDALAPDEGAAFEAECAARLRAAYPRRADGRALLPFRRLFPPLRR